jgi:hypothetical protein
LVIVSTLRKIARKASLVSVAGLVRKGKNARMLVLTILVVVVALAISEGK